MEALERLQRWFLRELHCNEEYAFVHFNFAPPVLRRDIGLLGLLHKRVLGLAHPAYDRLFPFHHEYWNGHSKQIYSHTAECTFQWVMFNRSIFGLASIYNKLPQWLVDTDTIKDFQRTLTRIAKDRCQGGDDAWKLSFNAHYHYTHRFHIGEEER